jgi:hypothetical protein
MLSHIREAIRIVSYREPQDGPGIVIAERIEPSVSAAGKRISRFLEAIIVICVFGPIAALVGIKLGRLYQGQSLALTTITGAVGVFLGLMVEWLRTDVERNIRTHINLADALAPFFGRRLDNAFRILKG